eukprot:482504-Amphidinium_carterae.1
MLKTQLVGPNTRCSYRLPNVNFVLRDQAAATAADPTLADAGSPCVGMEFERTCIPRLGGGPVGSRSALRALERVAELQATGTATLTNTHMDVMVLSRGLRLAAGRFHLLHPMVAALGSDSVTSALMRGQSDSIRRSVARVNSAFAAYDQGRTFKIKQKLTGVYGVL